METFSIINFAEEHVLMIGCQASTQYQNQKEMISTHVA